MKLVVVLLAAFASSVAETNWETEFLSIPNAAFAYENLAILTSQPHVAGTQGDFDNAQFVLEKFRSFGLNNSEILPFPVLLTYPIRRTVKLVAPTTVTLGLQEAYIPSDPTSGDPRIVPTYNGYSPSGNVTAELVYVNYCSYADFQQLAALGVNPTGKIVLCRYGGLFRGTKAMIAQQFGAVGVLIYSDPADDGYSQGPVFPDGPWRPASGVQRGSVAFLSLCPGDPSRKACSNDPNYNYTQGIPSVPVQPLSWSDALPLLSSLQGTAAPKSWKGGLNITYNIGPGPAVVNVDLDIEFVRAPIWNVIATIPGVDQDHPVILGNHRDAWVFGAADPNSGTASLLEVARAFGLMLQAGWKPQRTIILNSWDGEEFGLLGSTAWAESTADTVMRNAVAYLNVDTAVTGPYFGVGATPSLGAVLWAASQQVIDPRTGQPLSSLWNVSQMGVLGSGSDFGTLLDHFAVPSVDFGFGGAYGVYHSTYDDIHWMNNFGDPTYEYHKAAAQLWGLTAIKLADAKYLPFDFSFYATQLSSYVDSIQTLFAMYNKSYDLSELRSSVTNFSKAASQLEAEIANGDDPTSINERITFVERRFLGPGLPGRPYYRNLITAPGLYAGYDADVFPGLAQAIREQNWTLVDEQYALLWNAISAAATFLAGQ